MAVLSGVCVVSVLVTLVVLGGIDDFVAVLVEVAVRDVQELVVWLELLVVVVRDVVLVVLVVRVSVLAAMIAGSD